MNVCLSGKVNIDLVSGGIMYMEKNCAWVKTEHTQQDNENVYTSTCTKSSTNGCIHTTQIYMHMH